MVVTKGLCVMLCSGGTWCADGAKHHG